MRRILIIVLFLTTLVSFAQSTTPKFQITSKDTVLLKLQNSYDFAQNDSIKFITLIGLSNYYTQKDIGQAKSTLEEALVILKAKKYNFNQIQEAEAYKMYALINSRQGKFSDALSFNQKAIHIYTQLNDSLNISRISHNLSVMYRRVDDIEKSIYYCRKAIAINKRRTNYLGLAFNYNSLGLSLINLKSRDSSLYYFEKAKQYFTKMNELEGWHRANSNIAKILESEGKFKESLTIYLEDLNNKINVDYKQGIVISSIQVSRIYMKLKDYSNAEKYADKALSIAKENGFLSLIKSNYAHKVELYKSMQRYKDVYINNELYHIFEDSILNIDQIKKLQALELTFEFKKQKAIDSLQLVRQQKIEEAKLLEEASTRFWRSTSIMVAVFGLIFSFVYIKLRRRKEELRIGKLQNELLQTEIKYKQKDISDFALNISRNRKWREELLGYIKKIRKSSSVKNDSNFNALEKAVIDRDLVDNNAIDFHNKVDVINSAFYEKLQEKYPNLTKTETKLCSLIRLNIDNNEIAILQNVALESVYRSRSRLRSKLNLSKEDNLDTFLSQF